MKIKVGRKIRKYECWLAEPLACKVKGATRWPLYSEGGENLVFNGRGSYIASDDFRKDGIAFLNQLGSQLQH